MNTRRRSPIGWIATLILALAITVLVAPALAQSDTPGSNPKPRKGGGGGGSHRELVLPVEVTAMKSLSVVLGCPTDRSVVVSVLSA